MASRAIVCVSFGEIYEPYEYRLARSLAKHAPGDTYLRFDKVEPGWLDHKRAPYAFKIGAMREAAERGYRYVLWLDAGAHLVRSLESVWAQLERDGYYLVASASALGDWISDEALDHFRLTREEVWERGWPLLCGMPYAFDFEDSRALRFLAAWEGLAALGLFREQRAAYRPARSVVHGHRHDESIGAVLAQQMEMTITPFGVHYSGDSINDTCPIASGYDGRWLNEG